MANECHRHRLRRRRRNKLTFIILILILVVSEHVKCSQTHLRSFGVRWVAYCNFVATEREINSLSCNKCFESVQTNNEHCTLFNNLAYETNERPLLPRLSSKWYDKSLYTQINSGEIKNNLPDLTLFSSYANNFIKIELNNMDIEELGANSFSRFLNLKILNLSRNNIKHIELSIFSFIRSPINFPNGSNDTSTEISTSNISELDLSFNQLTNIKMESSAILENLQVLNISNNILNSFDLRFFSILAPQIKSLNLASNYLKKFQIFNDQSIIKSIAMLRNKPFSLIKTPISSDLTDLNLNNNFLTDFNSLFTINKNSVSNKDFCYIKGNNNNLDEASKPLNHRNPLNIHIKNNAWDCDCKTYEIISAIVYRIQSLNTTRNFATQTISKKFINSCYLNYFINLNSYAFVNFLDNFESLNELSCFNDQQPFNWLVWYTQTCVQFKEIKTTTAAITTATLTDNIEWLATVKPNQTLPNNSLVRYDISSSFYWICSVCIAIITISCLFIAWFYCWKRYSLSRRILMLQRRNMSATATNTRRTNGRNQRNRTQHNSSLLNSRMAVNNGNNSDRSEVDSSGSDQNRENINRLAQANLRTASRNGINTNPNGLYYISLNRNMSNRGIRFESNNLDNPINNDSYYDNRAYMNGEDEPPNYYEAILVKNRISNLIINKNSSNDGTVIELNEINLNSLLSEEDTRPVNHRIENTTESHSSSTETPNTESNTTTNSNQNTDERSQSLNDDQNDDEATLNDATVITASLERSDSIVDANPLDYSADSLDHNLNES